LLAACAHTTGAALGEGGASFYGNEFAGRPTASGEKFDPRELTAAHRTLPFGTCVRVVATRTGREVQVRVTDRGPHVAGRVIDLSKAAADELGITAEGVAPVKLYGCR
jgi:rare lipoprotein A